MQPPSPPGRASALRLTRRSPLWTYRLRPWRTSAGHLCTSRACDQRASQARCRSCTPRKRGEGSDSGSHRSGHRQTCAAARYDTIHRSASCHKLPSVDLGRANSPVVPRSRRERGARERRHHVHRVQPDEEAHERAREVEQVLDGVHSEARPRACVAQALLRFV